jgi:diguanylate cyclase (GGDEF)-like protein
MTGLLNRSFMDDSLPGLVQRCERADAPISCVFVDIDRFKSINDQYGHKVGDEVIRGIARLMMLGVRDNDPAIRYGGDEIVLVLPGSKESIAVDVAERIRRMIAGHDWDRTAPGLRVTCSFGVAQRVPDETITNWFDRTDKATFASKREGRNCVRSFASLDL